MKRKALFFIMFLSTTILLKGQNIPNFHLYSYNFALLNPAAAGAQEKHIVAAQGRLYVMQDFLDDFQLPYTGLLSYEGNFTPINSGIGAMVVSSGNIHTNTKKVGISYNYNIKFAPETSLRIGIRPTFSRYTIDYSQLDGGIDDKESSTKGDLDAGLYLKTFGFYVGASMTNLLKHSHAISLGGHDGYSDRMLSIFVGRSINLQAIKIEPSIAFTDQDNFSALWVNTNVVLAKVFMVGGTFAQSLNSEEYNVAANAGLSVAGKIDFIAHVYSRSNHRPYLPKDDMFFEGMIRVKI